MLIDAAKKKIQIKEIPIEVIYDSAEHHSTHFNPVKDSVRVYSAFLPEIGKFALSGIT